MSQLDKINIALIGAAGRMGNNIITLINDKSKYKLSYITGKEELVGQINTLSGLQYSKFSDIKNVDVIIDFSSEIGLSQAIEVAVNQKIPLVSGTTGISLELKAKLQEAAKIIPVFYSANMSIGVNILKRLAVLAAKFLDEEFDVEISEAHHKHKKDAPSGTALMLGQSIADAKNVDFNQVQTCHYHTNHPRKTGDIGFSVIRGGSIIGEHSINFISDEEIISLTHKANDRKLFAKGALLAAKWLKNKSVGLYSMDDLTP